MTKVLDNKITPETNYYKVRYKDTTYEGYATPPEIKEDLTKGTDKNEGLRNFLLTDIGKKPNIKAIEIVALPERELTTDELADANRRGISIEDWREVLIKREMLKGKK